jgi:hypothetical protein
MPRKVETILEMLAGSGVKAAHGGGGNDDETGALVVAEVLLGAGAAVAARGTSPAVSSM